jgi:hypothetical protein
MFSGFAAVTVLTEYRDTKRPLVIPLAGSCTFPPSYFILYRALFAAQSNGRKATSHRNPRSQRRFELARSVFGPARVLHAPISVFALRFYVELCGFFRLTMSFSMFQVGCICSCTLSHGTDTAQEPQRRMITGTFNIHRRWPRHRVGSVPPCS